MTYRWSGYLLKNEELQKIVFETLECDPDNGVIKGTTTDKSTAYGTINHRRQFKFKLESPKGVSLYVWGKMSRKKDEMSGQYGVKHNEADDCFKIQKHRVKDGDQHASDSDSDEVEKIAAE
jgi:hypothetical protein